MEELEPETNMNKQKIYNTTPKKSFGDYLIFEGCVILVTDDEVIVQFETDEKFIFPLIECPIISIGDIVEIALLDQDDFTQGFFYKISDYKTDLINSDSEKEKDSFINDDMSFDDENPDINDDENFDDEDSDINDDENFDDEDPDACSDCNTRNIVCYDKTGDFEAYKCLKCGNMWTSTPW